MFCFLLYFLFVFSLNNVSSLKLVSEADETIPTELYNEKVDNLSYQKWQRINKGIISLKYKLFSDNEVSNEKLELLLNSKLMKVKMINVDTKEIPSKELKIYVKRETKLNNTISYEVAFSKIEYATTGMYELKIDVNGVSVSAKSYIYSKPIVANFHKSKLGLEGDPLRITCIYDANPEASEIRWIQLSNTTNFMKSGNLSLDNSTIIEENGHFKFEIGKESKKSNDTLFITKLWKNDTGLYACMVISDLGSDMSVVKLSVKDRWAALYPFIGIVIEVILLVTAILAYERYQIRSQNKQKNYGENNDEDNKEPGIPLAAGGGDEENVVPETEFPQTDIETDKTNNVDSAKQRDTVTTKNV